MITLNSVPSEQIQTRRLLLEEGKNGQFEVKILTEEEIDATLNSLKTKAREGQNLVFTESFELAFFDELNVQDSILDSYTGICFDVSDEFRSEIWPFLPQFVTSSCQLMKETLVNNQLHDLKIYYDLGTPKPMTPEVFSQSLFGTLSLDEANKSRNRFLDGHIKMFFLEIEEEIWVINVRYMKRPPTRENLMRLDDPKEPIELKDLCPVEREKVLFINCSKLRRIYFTKMPGASVFENESILVEVVD